MLNLSDPVYQVNMLLVLIIIATLACVLINYYANNNIRFKIFSVLLFTASTATMIQHYFMMLYLDNTSGYIFEHLIWINLYLPISFYAILALVGLIGIFRKNIEKKSAYSSRS